MKGVRKGAGTFVRAQGAWGIVLGAFARAQGRGGVWHCFWGVRRGKQRSQGARTACMIVFAADVRFFCKFEFYVHIHYYF